MVKIVVVIGALLGSVYGFELGGTVISESHKVLSSRYMGFVKAVYVEEGMKVKQGDLLYTIDSKEIDTAKAQLELSIAQAELNLQMYANQHAHAKLTLERHERLLAKDMVSRHEVETLALSEKNLRSMVAIAQKQVEQAKAKRAEIDNHYRYLQVRAPNDGIVIAKQIKAGEMAMPGVSAVVLVDPSALKVLSEASENYLSRLHVDDRVDLVIDSIGFKGEGKVVAIIPSSDPTTHTFKIKIAFIPTSQVHVGMYTRIVVKE